jgi:hypothetical protein
MSRAGLKNFWAQCNKKFGGPTYIYPKTDNADRSQYVNENYEVIQGITHTESDRDVY